MMELLTVSKAVAISKKVAMNLFIDKVDLESMETLEGENFLFL